VLSLIWWPSSCSCIIKYDRAMNAIFIQQCRTHNTPEETYTHHKGLVRTEAVAEAESKKPEFQLRVPSR